MDLRLRARGSCVIGAAITRYLAAGLLFWAAATQAAPDHSAPDYLYPDATPGATPGGFLKSVSHLQSGAKPDKTLAQTTYRTFSGQSYAVQEYRGQYVSVLLTAAPGDGPFFTADHLEELVDRLDELYALYREILQADPKGSGLLTIAFVPETCGTGCGLIGSKGIEFVSDSLTYETIIRELDAGRLDAILVHEMAHNFDVYARYLHYLPDHAHAWTDFFQNFAAYRYGRNILNDEAPDDVFRSPVSAAWKDYVASAAASWENCVLTSGCNDNGLTANNFWAMLYYRMEALHGSAAIVRSFEFLTDYVSRSPVPLSPAAREDLRILSLAHGAGANIACHMDSLNWPVSVSLRSELQSRFGPPDQLCDDTDRDGFIAITGDCDEGDPLRHLRAAEIERNGYDYDCDGLVDEEFLVEAGLGGNPDNFVQAQLSRLPFEVEGSASDSQDNDVFSFPLEASSRVQVTLCGDTAFSGWAVALDADGRFLNKGTWYIYRASAGCSSATFDYGALGSGAVAVIADESTGDYALTVSATSDLPGDHSAYLSVVPRAAGGMRLQVNDTQRQLDRLGADELEIWIPGTEVRLTVPYAPAVAATLSRATAPQLTEGSLYQARIRPKANGQPLLPFSAGHLFRYQGGTVSLPQIDSRFSGAWFDPGHKGEGFIVEVLEDDRAVVYWFTYRADGRQRWMIGVGEVEGGRIVVEEMMDSRGGRFGAAFDPAEVDLQTTGSLSISFQDCDNALANYSIDNNGGHQVLTRLTDVYGHRCGSIDTAPATDISGAWYDPAHDGEGFVVEQLSADQASVYWFTYDAQGEQLWLSNTGVIENGRITFPDLLQPTGGKFGRSFDPATVRLDPWGSLQLQLDCRGGPAAYEPATSGFSSGVQQLVNLTRLQGSGCAQ